LHPAALLLETLRFGDPDPDADVLRAAWRKASTRRLSSLVEFEQCEVWLWRRLQHLDATDAPAPRFTAWLARRARMAVAQNLLVDEQAACVVRELTAVGIPHVLLKGAARRVAAGTYPLADARATHDLDVLVPAPQAGKAWDRLRSSGYEPAPLRGVKPGHFHLPPLWNDSRVAVELHTSTSFDVPPDVAWRRATGGCQEIERGGLQMRVPAATELLWHGLTHGLWNRYDAFRLRFLLDGAAICASGAAIDWREIGRRCDSPEVTDRRAAATWLGAAAWLARTSPLSVVSSVERVDLEHTLRWRFAVLRLFPPDSRPVKLLAAEGTRRQLGLTPTSESSRAATALARAAFALWQAV